MALEHIDKNSNKNISAEELHNALMSWFFDKAENIDAIQQQLKNYQTDIAKSFKQILEQQYTQINQKAVKTYNDNQIVLLYKKLFNEKAPSVSTHNNFGNNLFMTNNTNKPETMKPNLNWLEHNHDIEFKKLIDWAKNKYYSEYRTLIQNTEKKYAEKSPSVIQDYIKYESIIWAAGKYYKELEDENNQLLKKYWFYGQVNYEDQLGIKKQGEIFWWREFFACGELFTFLETIQYPWYEKDQELIQKYNTKSEQILKNRWYLWNNKFAEHGNIYQNFEKELNKKIYENKINESIQYLAKNPEPKDGTQESIDEYMHHAENTLLYSETYEQTTKKYGLKLLDWYIKTVQDLNTIQKDYPWLTQAMTRMADYNKKIEEKKSSLNISNETITKYIQYNKEASQSIYILQKRCWSLLEKVHEEIQWNTENNFIFPAVKKQIIEQKQKQAKTDANREKIKKRSPTRREKINNTIGALSHGTLSTIVWARNGLVDATIGVWTWLWVLITSIYRDQYDTIANVDRAKTWTNFFKIWQSAAQLEPPVKDWQRNLNFDNGTAQLGAQVSNMLVLLSWAGAVGRWFAAWWAKMGLQVTQTVWTRVWLFTWASMQWLPNTFQEYLWAWIEKGTAWKYALWATMLWSSLEMIAPNQMFFWNIGIKTIIKQLGEKEWAKIITKQFLKNISKEVGEEIGQESLQLTVERVINKSINNTENTNLETSLTWADFWTTAILTAMTTWLVSSKWSLQIAKNTINKPATIQRIVQDPERYKNYSKTLEQIIKWEKDMQIPKDIAQTILDQVQQAHNKEAVTIATPAGELPTIESNKQTETNEINNVDTFIQQIEQSQDILTENDVSDIEMTEQQQLSDEKLSILEGIQIKLFTIAQERSANSEVELGTKVTHYVINNVKHFIHECKMVFGTELIDLYKSYVQMKNHIGKPWDAEFQKIFQIKRNARWINLAKLLWVAWAAKIGIDPHLFFRSGHLVTDQLQKHIPFFDKLFHLSFSVMDDLYTWKEWNKTKYNPMTVIEKSALDNDAKKQELIQILNLDPNNTQHQELLDALIQAHEVGKDEPGKDPRYTAWVYNYTQAQIRSKYAILKPYIDSRKISNEQVKMLFDLGYLWQVAILSNDSQTSNEGNSETTNVGVEKVKIVDNMEQNFNLKWYTSQYLITDRELLTELYSTHILPQMEATDLVKKNIMQDIALLTNAKILDADLKGKDDPTRAIEKIITKLEGDPNKLVDISRWSLVFQDEQTLRIGLEVLQTHPDIQEIQIKDNFRKRETGYRDINIIIKAKTGKCFEIQLHTKNLLEAKEHWLNINREYVNQIYQDIQNGTRKNYYGDITEKIINNQAIFNDTDKRICNLVSTYIQSNKKEWEKKSIIQLPDSIEQKVSWHDLYEITRTMEIALNPNTNPNKIIPDWLKGESRENIKASYDKINQFSNLLYDYAYQTK